MSGDDSPSADRPDRDRSGEAGPRAAEKWAQVESLFGRAVELPESDRSAFLVAECADPLIRAEVESLLAAHEGESWFLDGPPPWTGGDPPGDPPAMPESIGPYRIIRPVGRGGMGQVYLAERQAPGFTRHVALKVMRRGLDTDDLIERFARERQILGRLDHPNIARLYDVGATADGRPYYVMEHIPGRPILEYCDANGIDVAGRIRLFRDVCDAVQYAHAALVVHRDLKPGNILVTDEGIPKLLDFGIARLLDDRTDRTELTKSASAPLTPGYAAPEQIRGEPVTTACDVYSLGILLYVLLCGQHPYAKSDARPDDTARLALTVDPPPPSRASTDAGGDHAARRRTTSPIQLRRLLEGDLDNIVLRAIRKEPAERYPSVLSFAEDLDRHTAGLPVRARPATASYRLRKFVGRNRLAVSAAALLFAVLAAATGLTLYQSARIREESARVALERDKALEVRSFLLEMFGSTGPDQPADSVTARQMLDRRRESLDEAYADDPETHAEMQMVLAEGYERLGLVDVAEPLARRALDTRIDLFGQQHADVVVSLNVLGWLQRQRGDLDEAEALLTRAVTLGRTAFPPDGDPRLARALNDLGIIRMDRGDADGATTHLRESLDMRRRHLGDRHLGVAITTSNLAVVHYNRGDLQTAVREAEAALLLFRDLLGPDHQRTLLVRQNLAALRSAYGDPAGAARRHRQVVDNTIERLGPNHPTVAWGQTLLAADLTRLGRLEEAETLALRGVQGLSAAYSAGHLDLAVAWRVLGDVRSEMGDTDQALRDYSAGLDVADRTIGLDHAESAILLSRIATVLERRGDAEAAHDHFRDAARIASTALGATHSTAVTIRLLWLEFLARDGRIDSARTRLAEIDSALNAFPDLNPLFEARLDSVRTALQPAR